jgi:N4-(beta-N-acetylglucosaminyl)-L-asparaginase
MRRRDILFASAALPAVAASMNNQPGSATAPIVISSANGTAACKRAMEILQAGGDTLEAVVSGVTLVEDDPEDNSVGYGGLPNEEGVVELDASVMHGPTRRCGAVAAVRNIKNVARLAKLVMEQTAHILLVGEGATRFAKAWGIPEMNLLTEKSRLAWMAWKQSLRDSSGHSNWTNWLAAPAGTPAPKQAHDALRRMFPASSEGEIAWAFEMARRPPTGTINCLALNAKGEMSGTTTTSGLAWKIPGRVGDSPIIGAGLFVDQEVGAAGSTGLGEENIRISGGHTIVENMRHGMTPQEACLDALKRIVRNYNGDLAQLDRFDINFYAIRKDGAYAGASLWSARPRRGYMVAPEFAVNTGGESRLEKCTWLLERKG